MARPVIVLAAMLATTLALSGCDVLAPTRDSDGRIIKATRMPSTDAWVDDCFSFVDGSNLAFATVVPCAQAHTHVVIGKGTLTAAKISESATLQIAIITACQQTVDTYLVDRDDDPTPEYIVSNKKRAGAAEVTDYSCLIKNAAP